METREATISEPGEEVGIRMFEEIGFSELFRKWRAVRLQAHLGDLFDFLRDFG